MTSGLWCRDDNEINCGQVRGPVQLGFSGALINHPAETAITRMAVTQKGRRPENREMGRKHIIPYALYRLEGYVSACLAERPVSLKQT